MALDNYLSPAQLAEALGVPTATVYKWQHEGSAPPSIRLGKHTRYPEPGVKEWLKAREGRPAGNLDGAA